MQKITTIEQLENIYGDVSEAAKWKEIDHINAHYQQFIEAAPFLILATSGEKGIDCSPRGDPAGFVRVVNEKCIQIPDRRGNNRLDTLRNIVANPQVGVIFMIPNIGETIRVSGKAELIIDPQLCESFAIKGKPASSVLSINVEKAYFQCQKVIARSKLWDSTSHIQRSELPSAGDMVKVFSAMQKQAFDAQAYDADYPERMKKTMY
jgi:PPOX class probable FMN-dependent enzyme